MHDLDSKCDNSCTQYSSQSVCFSCSGGAAVVLPMTKSYTNRFKHLTLYKREKSWKDWWNKYGCQCTFSVSSSLVSCVNQWVEGWGGRRIKNEDILFDVYNGLD